MAQPNTQDLRLGIVGTGSMACQMAHAARFVPRVSVASVLSRDASRASAFCSQHASEAIGFDDAAQFFDATDAVYVATPPHSHMAFIEQAIDAGKPILCEKPLTLSSTDTSRLLRRARDARVPLVEAIWTLALPAYREMKRTLEDRRNALLHFDFSYPVDPESQAHILDPHSGGVIVDRSVYGYAAAISLLGDVKQQTAWVVRDETHLEVDAELRLEHAEGARSLITLSINKVGSNLLCLSNGSGLTALGPTSLASETLRRVARPSVTRSSASKSSKTLKSRLKELPLLRALKTKLPAKQQYLSYGASSYAPILTEFVSVIEKGQMESEIVPHNLTEQAAFLAERARLQDERVGQ